jgi:hypothetical protein
MNIAAPPRRSALPVVALVFACLFFVPLLPLVGCILGIVAVARSKPGEPRGVGIAAIATGGAIFLFFQGIYIAIAIPAFLKFQSHAKAVEATMNLNRLHQSMEILRVEQGRGSATSDWTPPGTACSFANRRFPPNHTLWMDRPWSELNFSVDDPSYYQYRIVQEGDRLVAEARGDLDCDGRFSLFRYAEDGHLERQDPDE